MVLTEKNFDEQVGSGVALVDFWAPWCGPCRALTPTIDDIAAEMNGRAVIGKVNVDEEQGLAAKYNIAAIPAVLLFKDGELQKQMVGLQSKEILVEKIEELLIESN